MIQSFILKLLVEAVKNPDIRGFLLELFDRMADRLLPKLAAVIPAAVGAGIKGLGDLIPNIDLPDVGQVVETVRDGVNELLPQDIDVPLLSDAFESVTGFDLSDVLMGRNR